MASGFQAVVNRTDVFLQKQAFGNLDELLHQLLKGIETSRNAVKGEAGIVTAAMNKARILLCVACRLLEPEWKSDLPAIDAIVEERLRAIRERRRTPVSSTQNVEGADGSTTMYADLDVGDFSLQDEYRKAGRDFFRKKPKQYAAWNQAFTLRTRMVRRYNQAREWLRSATFELKSDRDVLCAAILAHALMARGDPGKSDLHRLYLLSDAPGLLEEYVGDLSVLTLGKTLFFQLPRVVDSETVRKTIAAFGSGAQENLLEDDLIAQSKDLDRNDSPDVHFFVRKRPLLSLEVPPSAYQTLFDNRLLKSGGQAVWGLREQWSLDQSQLVRQLFEGHERDRARVSLDDWEEPGVEDPFSNDIRSLITSLFFPLDPSVPAWMNSEKMLKVRTENVFASSSRFRRQPSERGFIIIASCPDYGSDRGYVEPIPSFFSDLGVMAIKCRRELVRLASFTALRDDEYTGLLRSYDVLSSMSFRLSAMCQKQLRGAPWDSDERAWFGDFHSMYDLLFGMDPGMGDAFIVPVDDDPSVVQMPPGAGSGRYACSGRPRKIYVLYPSQGQRILCQGAVGSFYVVDSNQGLNGAQFKRLLDVLVGR